MNELHLLAIFSHAFNICRSFNKNETAAEKLIQIIMEIDNYVKQLNSAKLHSYCSVFLKCALSINNWTKFKREYSG